MASEKIDDIKVDSPATVQPSSSTVTQNASLPQYSVPGPVTPNASKYNQLLALIEELGKLLIPVLIKSVDLGKDIRPTYTGNRNSSERLKRGIIHARVLVRECLHEVDKNSRQAP
jgi:hypothetical protein